MNILSIIPARGGSKGIPKKNIAVVGGKPLIAWAIEASLKSRFITRTIVSSDDPEILSTSEKYGAEIIKRPKTLASDKALSEPVVSHVIEYLKKKDKYVPDAVILLQPTAPLRDHKDIDAAISLFIKNPKTNAVISVCELERSYLKSFMLSSQGYLKGIANNKYPFMRRQDLPLCFKPNGAIYIVKTKDFMKNKRLITPSTLPHVMTKEKSMEIDTPQDLVNIKKYLP